MACNAYRLSQSQKRAAHTHTQLHICNRKKMHIIIFPAPVNCFLFDTQSECTHARGISQYLYPKHLVWLAKSNAIYVNSTAAQNSAKSEPLSFGEFLEVRIVGCRGLFQTCSQPVCQCPGFSNVAQNLFKWETCMKFRFMIFTFSFCAVPLVHRHTYVKICHSPSPTPLSPSFEQAEEHSVWMRAHSAQHMHAV